MYGLSGDAVPSLAECMSVVRPQEQYIFIHDAILEACLCGETAIPACEYKAAYYDMIRIDSQSNSSHLKDEFQVLEAFLEPFHIYGGTIRVSILSLL